MSAPAIDEGNPPTGLRGLVDQLRPQPGRMTNTLMTVAQVCLMLVIGEYFRFPQIAVLVWISFFLSGNDAATTLTTATFVGGMILAGTGLVILFLTFSLSDAGLRLAIMLGLTLAAGFLSKAMVIGAAANVLLFWIVYMSTNADLLEQVGFSIPATVGNTTDSVIPDAMFLPPEEAMVHILLWVGLVFALALLVLLIMNAVFGLDPATSLRRGLAVRLDAIANTLNRDTPTDRLDTLVREGVAPLRRMQGLASKLHRNPDHALTGLALVRDVGRLVMVVCTWRHLPPSEASAVALDEAATLARLCARVIERRNADKNELKQFDPAVLNALEQSYAQDPAYLPVARELVRTLRMIRAVLLRSETHAQHLLPEAVSHPRSLFKPDAFTNPFYPRSAARLGLSVAICYGIERFTAWPGIGTCVVTCFLVSLDTVGDSVQKMTLRITGALTGAALGIGAILFVMPYITNLSGLLTLVLPVAAAAAWVKSGSERVAYAGVQMAFAFFLCVLQDYGPTLDMQTGRDRVIGILIGNFVVFLVAMTLWPVSVTDTARGHLVTAVRMLGRLVAYQRTEETDAPDAVDPGLRIDHARESLREKFGQAVASVRSNMVNDTFEPDRLSGPSNLHVVDMRLVTRIQMLSVPVAIVNGHGAVGAASDPCSAMSHWFDRFAAWLETGDKEGRDDGADLRRTLPSMSAFENEPERAYWWNVLEHNLRDILDDLLPEDSSPQRKVANGQA